MSLSTRLVVFTLLLGLAHVTHDAQARPLFALPGDVRLVEVDDAASPVIGTDKQGFVWAYGNGGIYCYDPADPSGAASYRRVYGAFDHAGIAAGQVYLDPGWDTPLSYEGLYIPNPDFEPGGPQLQFQAYTCALGEALPTLLRVPMPTLPEWSVSNLEAAAFRRESVFFRDGELCAFQQFASNVRDPRPNGRLMCIDFTTGGAPTTSYPLAQIDLDQQLRVPTWEATYPGQPKLIYYPFGGDSGQGYTGPPFEGWTFAAPLVTTGGRVFFIATRQTAVYTGRGGAGTYFGNYGYPLWLLELKADGTVSARLSPEVVRTTAQSPIGLGLYWHEPTRSILVATNGSFEFGNYIQCGPDGFGNLQCAPHGPGGFGFFYVPLDRLGFGYFSIRDAKERSTRCRHDASHTGCTMYGPTIPSDPAGRVILTFMNREYNQPDALGSWKDVVDTQRSFRLDFDPATFDMDGDGLAAAEEDLLGTSDYDDDSDQGYTADSVEVGILETDAADKDDDAWRFDQNLLPEPSGYGTSRLIRDWLPRDVSDYTDSRVQALSADAPLCFRGRCLDVHTHEVMLFPVGETITDHVVSADTSFIAYREGTAFKRKFFEGETGSSLRAAEDGVETYVAAGELERFIGTSPPKGHLYPISRSLTYWVQTSSPPVVVAFDASGQGSLVFDLLAAACESELGPCASEPIANTFVGATDGLDELFPDLEPVGYASESGRLLVGVKTNWRQFIIALQADSEPVLLRSQSAYNAIPTWFTPTGHGHDYLEFLGNPRLLTADLGIIDRPVESLDFWVVGSPRSYWGDITLVQAWTGGSYGSQLGDGALEAVWFPPEVAPGEVLAFDPFSAKLARFGLRGGALTAWAAPEPTEHGVTGIDVTADLRMCATNPRAGHVREYLPRFGRAAPSVTEDPDILMPNAIDCAYGDDGALRVLVSEPPAVWVRLPGQTTFTVDASITVPAAPKRFVRGPGGKGFAAIAGADDPAAGRLVTRAGVVVDIPKGTWHLRWNGIVVADLRPTMFWNSVAAGPNIYPEIPGDVVMVERADGRIVFALQGGYEFITSGPFIYEPRSGTVLQAAEGPAGGSLLAVVPGADNVDPWTGDRLGPPVPRSLLGPSAPVATPAPSGGTLVPAVGGEGCAGGSGPIPWLALALILLGRTRVERVARRRNA